MLTKYITVKGKLIRWSLYSNDGRIFELSNYYSLQNECEYGYFQLEPLSKDLWYTGRRIIINKESI